jgi:hypothetical protein
MGVAVTVSHSPLSVLLIGIFAVLALLLKNKALPVTSIFSDCWHWHLYAKNVEYPLDLERSKFVILPL